MATRSAQGTMTVSFQGSITNTPTAAEGGNVTSAPISASHTVTLTSGTGANNMDRAWIAKKNVIAASETDVIGLADMAITAGGAGDISNDIGFGAANDNLGQALAFVDLNGLLIINSGTTTIKLIANAQPLTIFDAAADAVTIPAGGFFAIGGGEDGAWGDLTAGVDDTIDITNLDASAGEYTIVVFGRSA